MKVFISHSSRDKWIARRISEDINNLGAKTFLDEKDIETGEPIDQSINDQLKDCDEILILFSPSSLESHWVLMEVGGAKALDKRLIPILLHLGANELPAPISKHLARDLNEIEKYYIELKKRIDGVEEPSPQKILRRRRTVRQPIKPFKKGDKVVIAKSPQRNVIREDYAITWEDEMTEYLGMAGIVTEVDTDKTLHLDVDNGENWWAFEWLSKKSSGKS